MSNTAPLPRAPLPAPSLPADVRAALCLDFDGTLVDIAARPDAITVPAALPDRLARLHRLLDGALVIVSGRGVGDILHWLPTYPGVIIGSHGAEQGERGMALPPPDPTATHMQAAARRFAERHPGLLIEDKPHGVVMHYRAAPALRPEVDDFMATLAQAHPGMTVQPAKMAVELRPEGATKDSALARLLDQPPFAGRLPVYAGDDATDEPAMALCQRRGGLGVKVGTGDTVAQAWLADPAAVARWLDGPTFQ